MLNFVKMDKKSQKSASDSKGKNLVRNLFKGERHKRSLANDSMDESTSTPVKSSAKKSKAVDSESINDLSSLEGMDLVNETEDTMIQEILAAVEAKTEGHGASPGESFQEKLNYAVQLAIGNILPGVVKVIAKSLTAPLEQKVKEMQGEMDNLKVQLEHERIRKVIWEDKHDQFSRRDHFIVEGIREKQGQGEETVQESKKELLEAVKKMGEVLGVAVEEDNIGDIHRIGKRNERKPNPRPVLVKANRRVKTSLFGKKKQLKNNDLIKKSDKFVEKASIYEDLTPVRRKINKEVRDCENVDFSFTRDGTIVAKLKGGSFININDAEDLSKIGLEVDIATFYDGESSRGSYTDHNQRGNDTEGVVNA